MDNSKINVFITPHFHYDYLWCDTPDGMGAKTAKIIKEALIIMRKYPAYKYVIDSVMAVEYFRVNYPEMISELKQRIEEKRIELIGGMIIAPDTLLPNGESLVRQVLYGTQYFKENFNVDSKVGYLLDSFGQTPQLPQILKKSGFKFFIFVRGANNRNLPQEFIWKGLDGSKILTHWMYSRYHFVLIPFTGTILPPFFPFFPILFTPNFIPQNFKVYEILKKICPPIKYIFRRLAAVNFGIPGFNGDMSAGLKFTIKRRLSRATTNNIFILNGTDNIPPSSNIVDAVEYLQKKSKNYNVKLTLPSEFLNAVIKSRKKFGVVEKYEFNGYPDKFPGTFSSRIRLKQKIRALENQFYLTELVSSLASLNSDYDYPLGKITKAIKRVLCCDFHDGICGCHVDATYNVIMKMLRLSEIQLNKIFNEAVKSLTNKVNSLNIPKNSIPLLIFNPLSIARTETTKFVNINSKNSFLLKDENQQIVHVQKNSLSKSDHEYLFIASDIPSIGYKLYHLEYENSTEEEEIIANYEIRYGDDNRLIEIENNNLFLSFENNKLKFITDKKSNFTLQHSKYYINDILISNDRGDSYLHGKITKKTYTTFDNELEIIEKGPVRIVIQIKSKLQCKAKWFFKPVNEITQYIILYNFDIPRIDFITKFKNRIKNVRIQSCFPVDIENPRFHSEVPYGFIERDIKSIIGESWKSFKKKFSHYDRIFPVINWMDVSDLEQKKGYMLINYGLPEYEIGENEEYIYLTLLRSTGYVSNIFPGAVPKLLGPFYSIPKALELSDHEFYYSLYFHSGDIESNSLTTKALCHNIPLITKQINIQNGPLHPTQSFIRIEPENFLIKVIKNSEDQENVIIIRVIETSSTPSTCKITFNRSIKRVNLVNLLEIPIEELNIKNNNSFSFSSKSQEILTFSVEIL